MIVRPAQLADLDGISAIVAAERATPGGCWSGSPANPDGWLSFRLANRRWRQFVAEADGAIVGYGYSVLRDVPMPQTPLIGLAAVYDDRRDGVMRALTESLISQAKADGFARVAAMIASDATAVDAFALSFGSKTARTVGDMRVVFLEVNDIT